tara:strand:- start:720 stop:1094 length:375 start_codon:yes stop_codon:yes gene_type:complete
MRWALLTSAVLNSILIMTVTGVLPFFLYLSILINIGTIWFIFSLIRQVNEANDDLENMLSTFFNLEEHIKTLYSMEMFYGDETLKSLIEHTRQVVDEIDFYRKKYSLEEDGDIEYIVDEDDEQG